jgi:hypothetical protein
MLKQIVPFDPIEAQKHKIAFYSLPQDVDFNKIDPLMCPIISKINSSGWVWTAECCQGHPDTTEAVGWDHNTSPYLRLVVLNGRNFKDMLLILMTACRGHVVEIHTVERDLWVEVLLYVKAINVLQRNAGIRALTKFAEGVFNGGFQEEQLPVSYIKIDKPPVLLASRLRALAEKIVIDPRFRVSIGSGVTTELQTLFRGAADAVDENEELKCQAKQLVKSTPPFQTDPTYQHPSVYKIMP